MTTEKHSRFYRADNSGMQSDCGRKCCQAWKFVKDLIIMTGDNKTT